MNFIKQICIEYEMDLFESIHNAKGTSTRIKDIFLEKKDEEKIKFIKELLNVFNYENLEILKEFLSTKNDLFN